MIQRTASRLSKEAEQFYGNLGMDGRATDLAGAALFNHAIFMLPDTEAALVTAHSENQAVAMAVHDQSLFLVFVTPPEDQMSRGKTRQVVCPLDPKRCRLEAHSVTFTKGWESTLRVIWNLKIASESFDVTFGGVTDSDGEMNTEEKFGRQLAEGLDWAFPSAPEPLSKAV